MVNYRIPSNSCLHPQSRSADLDELYLFFPPVLFFSMSLYVAECFKQVMIIMMCLMLKCTVSRSVFNSTFLIVLMLQAFQTEKSLLMSKTISSNTLHSISAKLVKSAIQELVHTLSSILSFFFFLVVFTYCYCVIQSKSVVF